jgi:hypothetical protein
VIILKDIASLHDLLTENGMLLVDVRKDALQLLSEDYVLVHHEG